MMSRHIRWLVIIVLLTIFSIWVILPADTKGVTPDEPICREARLDPTVDTGDVRCTENLKIDLNGDRQYEFDLPIQQSLGLDLVGGLRVLLEAQLPPDAFSSDDLAETANNVSRRVNALGLAEATIQLQGSNRILVELPGVRDRQQAVNTIQQTALLEFVDFGGLRAQSLDYVGRKILTTEQVRLERRAAAADEGVPEALRHPVTGEPFTTVMTGAGLQSAVAQISQHTGGGLPQWQISFEVAPDFVRTFGEFTGSRIGEPLAIVLDGEVLSAPIVQSRLDTGGVITGQFTEEEAQTLALQLRSGALPIPLSVISAEEVGATLGQESVRLSVRAGVLGVMIVLSFMLVYYRVPGIAADIALIVFIILNLAVFKLIPVTLTLPAITGFLISIGTAVDGNILIFERIKEELRSGKALNEALDAGFDRAWTSIRDSNLSTITVAAILFFFGQTPGASIVSGFAITLALGLIINLFTAVTVTRTFLHLFVRIMYQPLSARKWLLGV